MLFRSGIFIKMKTVLTSDSGKTRSYLQGKTIVRNGVIENNLIVVGVSKKLKGKLRRFKVPTLWIPYNEELIIDLDKYGVLWNMKYNAINNTSWGLANAEISYVSDKLKQSFYNNILTTKVSSSSNKSPDMISSDKRKISYPTYNLSAELVSGGSKISTGFSRIDRKSVV